MPVINCVNRCFVDCIWLPLRDQLSLILGLKLCVLCIADLGAVHGASIKVK